MDALQVTVDRLAVASPPPISARSDKQAHTSRLAGVYRLLPLDYTIHRSFRPANTAPLAKDRPQHYPPTIYLATRANSDRTDLDWLDG